MPPLARGVLFGLLIEAGLVFGFLGLSAAYDAASRGQLPTIHFARSE